MNVGLVAVGQVDPAPGLPAPRRRTTGHRTRWLRLDIVQMATIAVIERKRVRAAAAGEGELGFVGSKICAQVRRDAWAAVKTGLHAKQ